MFKRRQYQVLTAGREARLTEIRTRSRRLLLTTGTVLIAILAILFLTLFLRQQSLLAEDYRSTIDIGGQDRVYYVHLPPGYDHRQVYPLVIVFPGLTQSAPGIRATSDFDTVANKHEFIVVYPEAFLRIWEIDSRDDIQVDDLEFVDALLDRLQEEVSYDPDRVFATGLSRGGIFSYRLACERSDRFTAIAPVAGSMTKQQVESCHPDRPVPVAVIHGAADTNVPYDNTPYPDVALNVPEALAFWAGINGCSGSETVALPDLEEDGATTKLTTYTGCDADIVAYVTDSGGHTWPGATIEESRLTRITTQDYSASEAIWEFFSQQTMTP